MNTLDLLVKSIELKKPISFQYNKPGKVIGVRKGNVHAVYIFESKAGIKSTKVHIVQTGGVSDSGDVDSFPEFRTFELSDISDVSILNDEMNFEIYYEKYNPEWSGYANTIAKV